jgi:hypothetical protein
MGPDPPLNLLSNYDKYSPTLTDLLSAPPPTITLFSDFIQNKGEFIQQLGIHLTFA